MPAMYCALCRRPVEAKRHIGIGTAMLAFVTGGLWLVAIPFYSKRCCICRSPAVTAIPPEHRKMLMQDWAPERLVDMQKRLAFAETELEAMNSELDRVRTERDFYRQLVGDPVARERDRRLGGGHEGGGAGPAQ